MITNKWIQQRCSIQKYVLFPYSNNKLSEREIRKTIPFVITSEVPGINLAKETKDLYIIFFFLKFFVYFFILIGA